MDFLLKVPKLILEREDLNYKDKEFILQMVSLHHAKGIRGYTDDEGNQIEFTFLDEEPFYVPIIAFALYEDKVINVEELMIYSYFCYVSRKVNKTVIPIDIEMIKKRTQLSKRKIKDTLDVLLKRDLLLKKINSKTVSIHILEEKELEKGNSLLMQVDRDIWSKKHLNIMQKLHNEEKLDIYDFNILNIFLQCVDKNKMTMEEIAELLVESIKENNKWKIKFTKKTLEEVIKKAENLGLFRVKMDLKGNVFVEEV